jgi:hypothetical protein
MLIVERRLRADDRIRECERTAQSLCGSDCRALPLGQQTQLVKQCSRNIDSLPLCDIGKLPPALAG